MIDVLKRCSVLRIAFFDEGYPYIVPVSFGIEEKGDYPILYFHCALEGKKLDCIEKNGNVGIEADIYYKTEPLGHGITARYESVIGCGKVKRAEGEEIISGLNSIFAHYGYEDFDVKSCASLSRTAVFGIVLHSLTGKRNLPV